MANPNCFWNEACDFVLIELELDPDLFGKTEVVVTGRVIEGLPSGE